MVRQTAKNLVSGRVSRSGVRLPEVRDGALFGGVEVSLAMSWQKLREIAERLRWSNAFGLQLEWALVKKARYNNLLPPGMIPLFHGQVQFE
jgi:hypothetical protein